MTTDVEIKHIINRIEKVTDKDLLKAIKSLLDYGSAKEKIDISQFSGIISKEEADELESIIENGCEQIDNEW